MNAPSWKFAAAALLLFGVAFVLFRPTFFLSIDEHGFAKNAALLKEGKWSEPDPERACRSNSLGPDGYRATQLLGKSVSLIPFAWNLDTLMLSGLLVHGLNALLLYAILRRLGIDPRWMILYLFFPTFVWESRTLYSELLVVTGVLCAWAAWLEAREWGGWWAGLALGASVWVRYETAIFVAAFAAFAWQHDRKKLVGLFAGFGLIVAALLAFNAWAYGSPFSSGYGDATGIATAARPVDWTDIVGYGVVLLVPVLAVRAAAGKATTPRPLDSWTLFLAIAFMGYVLFNARFTHLAAFDISLESALTSRLRYVVPLLAIGMVVLAEYAERLLSRWRQNPDRVFAAAMVVGIVAASAGMALHQQKVDARNEVRRLIQANVPPDALLVGSLDDCMYSLNDDLSRRRYLHILPQNDLGPAGKDVNVRARLDERTFFIRLDYGRAADGQSVRDRVEAIDRNAMEQWIGQNRENLELVFETRSPYPLALFRWTG